MVKLSTPKSRKPVVGWREWVSLPELGIEAIKAKVDTGARTSAIHAYQVEHFTRDGNEFVHFILHPEQKKRFPEVGCEARLIGLKQVTSSTGHKQTRFAISTPVRIGDHQFDIDLTLTNRDEMGFRMLLGRRALRRRFLVDPGRSYVQGPKRPEF